MTEPLRLVRDWYEEAFAAGLPEPNAMALATATGDGVPAVRFVLHKGIDDDGVRFYTNFESRKGRELAANARAAASATRSSSHSREGISRPCGEAHAPRRLPRAREA